MSKHDSLFIAPGDLATSLALLTRLPIKARFERGAKAAWAYPLVGVVLTLLAAVPTSLALTAGLAPSFAALIWLACSIILTGAMHEDGLAETVDGFWGGWDIPRRLEIMKDSQIGSYGVLALCLSFAARWMAVSMLLVTDHWMLSLMVVATLSRAAMPAVMCALPHARNAGLSQSQGRPSLATTTLAALLAVALAIGILGTASLALIIIALGIAGTVTRIAKAKIAGQTGDILGATQQLVEIGLLMALTMTA